MGIWTRARASGSERCSGWTPIWCSWATRDVQYERWFGRARVVNPGSVGLPLDGNPGAAYAVLEDGRIDLRRLAYPIDRTVDELGALGLASEAVALLAHTLRTGSAPQGGEAPAWPDATGSRLADARQRRTLDRIGCRD